MSRRPNRAELDAAFSSELMTKAAAARKLGMSPACLNRYIAKGRLATVTVDGRNWVRRDDLNAFESEWKRNRDVDRAKARAQGEDVRRALAEGMLTQADAARQLGVAAQTVADHVNRGNLPVVLVDGHRLVRREDLEAFKAAKATPAGMLTIGDAARELGVDDATVRYHAKVGNLASVWVHRRLLVRREHLDVLKFRKGPEVLTALTNGMLTLSDVARELDVTRQRVHQYVSGGQLPTVLVDGRRLVRREDLDAFKLARDGKAVQLVAVAAANAAKRDALAEAQENGMLTLSDVARELAVDASIVYGNVYRGGLLTVKVGGRRLVRPEDLEAFKLARDGKAVQHAAVAEALESGLLMMKDVARELGMSKRWVAQLVKARRLRLVTVKVGGRDLVRPEDIEAFKLARDGKAVQHAAVAEALESGMLTMKDVARELGVSQQRVGQLVKVRRLASVKVGGRRLVRPEDLDAFMQKPMARTGPKARTEQTC
ncbi:helix-turn-helix domain-containing protein [Burkholderia cenocepacia]|uniref:helix-turn-helix domain-containing protein n=1 Tax=Burkholderia cenocepacia TaxID=95486 RepID=UPI00265212C4|nr:helix-turn-helix domain-containing protein [Burkholderia cenocepacia]MDN7536796.1 helix-turn-helix domain-containing protein [Burkholderia cenocepacia]